MQINYYIQINRLINFVKGFDWIYNTFFQFHTELRKILVSLVKVSEKLLRYHPEVVALFKEMAEGKN